MKKLMLISLLVLFYSCNNDDETPLDRATQLQIDLNIIDEHLAESGQAVIIHPSGLRYSIDSAGQSVYPVDGDSVTTAYDIYTLDGRLIDTTHENVARANGVYSPNDKYQPFVFQLGKGLAIEGYEISTKLLGIGGVGTFYVPSTLAYGYYSYVSGERNQIFKIKIQLQEIL